MDSSYGAKIAKSGLDNEKNIVDKFMNWKNDYEAQSWLTTMGYDLNEIEYVYAQVIHGYKTDVQVQVTIKFKKIIESQNLQIKLVSNNKGFNQIDKRWINQYKKMWNIPENIVRLLQYFTGEILPYRKDTRDSRRMFMNEFTNEEQQELIKFFEENKALIILDIVKGRGILAAEWILVIKKTAYESSWILKPINIAINHYSIGRVKITNKGSMKIGRITMQRKGGDNGRDTAKMLQFKVDPIELFNIN